MSECLPIYSRVLVLGIESENTLPKNPRFVNHTAIPYHISAYQNHGKRG